MKTQTLRIATRQSPLALWQANHVRKLLLKQWPQLTIELLPMVTSGDKFIKDKLLAAGGKGLFVKELEDALLKNNADIAVHSTKDMPAQLPAGLAITAICKRENPFDALLSQRFNSLDSLPPQAIIGTASLRRQSQLLAYRPDFQIKTLRGNINTRLSKLAAGEYDAIILAAAGLERMGFEEAITQVLDTELMLPTCGQGALCIESRSNDDETFKLISGLNDIISATCVNVERSVNAQLGGNCHVPLAVFCAPIASDTLSLKAKILSLDGTQIITHSQTGSINQAQQLADDCTANLLAQGAAQLLESIPL